MKWNKKIIGFGTALSVFFLSLFVSSCISTSTYALSDVVLTFNSSFTSYQQAICDNTDNNKPNCSDYGYVILRSNVPMDKSNYQNVTTDSRYPSMNVYTVSPLNLNQNSAYLSNVYFISSNEIIFKVSDLIKFMPYNIRYSENFNYSGWEITATLTESIGSGSSCPESPSGTYEVTENGTYDISQYEYVDVDIPETIVYGDYHNDLVNIYHAIVMCGGVVMVLYFFYCIYRLIIKNTGGM